MYNNIMRKWPFMKVSYAPRLAGKGFSFLAIQRAIKGIFIVPYMSFMTRFLCDTLSFTQRRVCGWGCLPASLYRDGHCKIGCPETKENI